MPPTSLCPRCSDARGGNPSGCGSARACFYRKIPPRWDCGNSLPMGVEPWSVKTRHCDLATGLLPSSLPRAFFISDISSVNVLIIFVHGHGNLHKELFCFIHRLHTYGHLSRIKSKHAFSVLKDMVFSFMIAYSLMLDHKPGWQALVWESIGASIFYLGCWRNLINIYSRFFDLGPESWTIERLRFMMFRAAISIGNEYY